MSAPVGLAGVESPSASKVKIRISRHPRERRDPCLTEALDVRLRGNDGIE